MSVASFGFPVVYKGSKVTFVKTMANLTDKQVYCNCVPEHYKKIVTAENNPQQSNAMRISQLLSASTGLGGKIIFGNNANRNVNNKFKALNGYETPATRPLRNKF
jgi:hypothetical protein